MKSIHFYSNPTHFPPSQQTTTTSTQKGNNPNSTNSISIARKWRNLQPLNCAINEPKPSKNGAKLGKGKLGAASVAMACVVGIIGASMKMNFRAIAGPREMYQKAPQMEFGYSLGGRSALKSLLDVNVNLSCDHLEPPNAIYQLPSRPSAEEVKDIKMEAVRLMKYEKAEDAISLLRNAYELYKYDPEPAYNVEMALVEILISQGKYMEASDCNCLKDNQRLPSDARFPLYKAIICTMLDDTEEARKWWDEYVETIEGEFDPTKKN